MRTYTVKVHPQQDGSVLWQTTNAIEVVQNHEPGCHLVRYVENGKTNEFHAWAAPIVIETNGLVVGGTMTNATAFYANSNSLLLTFTTKTLMMVDTNDTSWVTIKRGPLDTFNGGLIVGIIIALLFIAAFGDTSPIWRRNRK